MRLTPGLAALAALFAVATASTLQCSQRPSAGTCLGRFTRYYWDSITGECKSFTYGGCGGAVPFETRAACESAACNTKRCLLRGKMGRCEAAITKYQYNTLTKKCETFIWGGCDGLVPFDTRAECEGECVQSACDEKPNPGMCLAFFKRYFFDKETKSCKQFVYGGCGGNVPFETLQDCKNSCPVAERCALAPKTGPCRARFERYYFDAASGACKQFVWGGCKGVVPFTTLATCEQTCEM